MEAAASVVSIVAFALQAIEAINWLQDFYEEHGKDRKSEFLSQLTSAAASLTNVKLLCEEIKTFEGQIETNYRIDFLEIQVEDCAKELQSWLEIGKRLRSPPETGHKTKWGATLIQSHWAGFINKINSSSRTNAVERLQWHRGAIDMSLAIVGRKFDLNNGSRLRRVEDVTQLVHEKLSSEAEKMVMRLDSVSASMSSIEAHSRNANEHMMSVRAETSVHSAEIRELKEMLGSVVSSQSARSSYSARSSNSHRPGLSEHEQPSTHLTEATRSARTRLVDLEMPPPPRPPFDIVSRATSESGHEPEFKSMLQATRALIKGLSKLYHPALAEYISTTQALTVLNMHRKLAAETFQLGLLSIPDHRMPLETPLDVENKMRATKMQLLQLRALCRREGLTVDLVAVDEVLGISEAMVLEWSESCDAGHKLDLTPLLGRNTSLEVERATRIAEWMLGVTMASTSQMNLYKEMHAIMARHIGLSTNIDMNEIGDAERNMLKYWFLDDSCLVSTDSAPSIVNATILSEVVSIVQNDTTDWPTIDIADPGEKLPRPVRLLLELKAPAIGFESVYHMFLDCHAAPEYASTRLLNRAEAKLSEYRQLKSFEISDLDGRIAELEHLLVDLPTSSIEGAGLVAYESAKCEVMRLYVLQSLTCENPDYECCKYVLAYRGCSLEPVEYASDYIRWRRDQESTSRMKRQMQDLAEGPAKKARGQDTRLPSIDPRSRFH